MTAPRGARDDRDSGRAEHNTAHSDGAGSLSIGKHVGKLGIFFTGLEKWSVWNWVPCGLAFVLAGVALLLRPSGPWAQFGGVYTLLAVAVCATFVRALAGGGWRPWLRAVVSWAAVGLAVVGIVLMRDLRSHGEIEVTGDTGFNGDTGFTSAKLAGDGDRHDVIVRSDAARDHLRLTLDVTEGAEDAQTCLGETTFDVAAENAEAEGHNRALKPGEVAEVRLPGGRPGPRSVTVTVHTPTGCLIKLSVAGAVLYD